MGILDVILGRDAQGSPSKINMALIALLLWRWYQSQSAGGAQPQPAPAPRGGGGSMPRVPRQQMPEPDDEPVQIPTRKSGSGNDFDELRDSVRRVPRGNGGGEIEAGGGGLVAEDLVIFSATFLAAADGCGRGGRGGKPDLVVKGRWRRARGYPGRHSRRRCRTRWRGTRTSGSRWRRPR